MSNNTTRLPAYTAADELDRRSINKRLPKADRMPAPATAEGRRLVKLTGEELRAELDAAPKAPKAKAPKAPKAAPAKPVDPNVELRKAAWAYRQAEYAAGRKVTYAAACAKFGTKPAKSA